MVSFTLRLLYPRGKHHRYPLYRRVDGPQSRPGSCEEEKNIFPLRESTHSSWIVQHEAWSLKEEKNEGSEGEKERQKGERAEGGRKCKKKE
jgi:hypothetical protein